MNPTTTPQAEPKYMTDVERLAHECSPSGVYADRPVRGVIEYANAKAISLTLLAKMARERAAREAAVPAAHPTMTDEQLLEHECSDFAGTVRGAAEALLDYAMKQGVGLVAIDRAISRVQLAASSSTGIHNEPVGPAVAVQIDHGNGPSGPDALTETEPSPPDAEIAEAFADGAPHEDAAIASNWVQMRLLALTPQVRDRLTGELADLLQATRRSERRRLADVLTLSAEEREAGAAPATILEMLGQGRPPTEGPNRSHWRYLDLAVIEEWQQEGGGQYAGNDDPGTIIRAFYKARTDAAVALNKAGDQLAVWTGSPEVERPAPFA